MILQNSTDIKTELFYDENGDIVPIDVNYEKHVINPNGLIQLQNIPSLHTVFTVIRRDGADRINYSKVDEVINQFDFKVDYLNGILTFHSSQIGMEVKISYTNAIGRLSISADRIFTNTDQQGSVTQTLNTLIEEGQSVLNKLDTIGGVIKITEEMRGNIASLKSLAPAIIEGANTSTRLESDISNAKTENASLVTEITTAGEKIAEMNNWVRNNGNIVDLNNRVKTTETNITTVSQSLEQNTKYLSKIGTMIKNRNFKPIFGYNVMWGEATDLNGNYAQKNHIDMMNDIKHCENLGIDEVTIAMYIGYNIITEELYNTNDVNFIFELMEMYKDYNVKMKTLKLHLSFSESDFRDRITYEKFIPKYKIFVGDLCVRFKNTTIENVIVYNEFPDIYCNTGRDNNTIEIMNIAKNNGYKVGISTRGIIENYKLSSKLLENSDLICANIYPKISFKGKNTTFEDSENAWEQNELNLFFEQRKREYPEKELIMSETGIINCWEDLEGAVPSGMQVTKSSKATEVYLRGMFNALRDKPINRIWWWFGIYPGDDNNLQGLFNYEMRGIVENE